MWRFLIAVIISLSPISILAQDIETIIYSDTYTEASEQSVKVPFLTKAQRANRNASHFVVINSDLDENVSKALDYAFSVWEGSILTSDSIYIEVRTEDIEESIRTAVQYFNTTNEAIPLALKYHNDPLEERNRDIADGIITINSNINWDYNIGDNISSDGNNLAYGLMRAIARILGFGSSIEINDSGNFYFQNRRYHTVFDKRIENSDGLSLSSIKVNGGRPSGSLDNYINTSGQEFFVRTNDKLFKLDPPPYTREYPPFVFLADQNSLMGGKLSTGNYILNIDETTKTILRDLGWNIQPKPSVNIKSEDVPDTGIASAYDSHRFSAECGDAMVKDPLWSFILPLVNGTMQIVHPEDNNLSCTIPPIADPNLYHVNQDGDIEGVLQFSCVINGIEVKAPPFKLFLELKPLIEYASIEEIVDNAPYASYDAHYKVKYRGADKIKVSVEEEYSSKLKTCYIREPYIAYGVADHITAPYYAWIDFTAENKYGKSIYSIEIEPHGSSWSKLYAGLDLTAVRHSDLSEIISGNDRFEVYDAAGIKVGDYTDIADIDRIPRKGLLIIKHIRGGAIIRTFKKMNS